MLLGDSVGTGSIVTFHLLLTEEQADARKGRFHKIAPT
jgi:hypothetical protein